jgi:hypothetical protein
MKKNAAEDALREVFRSPEYVESLKARVLAGTARKAEIDLARSLGMPIGESIVARENMARMDRATLRVLMDMNRLALSPASPELRLIRSGDFVGVGYSVSTRAREEAKLRTAWNAKPTPETAPAETDDESLLPPKPARTAR